VIYLFISCAFGTFQRKNLKLFFNSCTIFPSVYSPTSKHLAVFFIFGLLLYAVLKGIALFICFHVLERLSLEQNTLEVGLLGPGQRFQEHPLLLASVRKEPVLPIVHWGTLKLIQRTHPEQCA
jgi:hypothetical protein